MNYLDNYAKLLVLSGVAIQPNQYLVIKADIQAKELVRACAKHAYEAGARDVIISWSDEISTKTRFELAPDDVFDAPQEWTLHINNDYVYKDAAFLIIDGSDPDLLSGIDPERLSRSAKGSKQAFKPYYDHAMNNKIAWCVASIATPSWASKVYPDLPIDEAVDKLWAAIYHTTRADLEDPVKAWDDHQKQLDIYLEFMNSHQFSALEYKNSIGTDVTVELPENHVWFGGGDDHEIKHYKFIANMPTEEIFSLPKKTGVNGKIVSSLPLSYNGVLIEDFWFEFKDGKIVDFNAGKNRETLQTLVDTDEGSHFLGEVALVPYDSPISNLKTIFYNTLFDENASCHFAIGRAYPVCIEGGPSMDANELEAHGVNDSLAHVDFMVGTKDLSVTGVLPNGNKVPIMRDGNFVIE